MHLSKVEYIWLDGSEPTQKLRSKTRILPMGSDEVTLQTFPEWGYDGSSTNQADGENSDLILKPVFFTTDPIRGEGNWLVMCEVMNADGTPHASNTRAKLRELMEAGAEKHDPWIGFEQEYTMYEGRTPLGWPEDGFPAPQGQYYCGVGTENVFGRDIVEWHMEACLEAGLGFYGINAEVMPGQWEFQVGYRGVDGEAVDPVTMSDHLWVARWLLNIIAEEKDVRVSLDCKPVKGDWNGAGMHTNFSTKEMREEGGMTVIKSAIESMGKHHESHIHHYGAGLAERLTGDHETCHMGEFKWGVSNRGASVRIPLGVEEAGKGYLEDRRPGANADPYMVSYCLLEAITGTAAGTTTKAA